MTAGRCLLFRGEQCRTHNLLQVPIAELAERWTELPQVSGTAETSRNITAPVIERDVSGPLHRFLEESRGFRTCQNGRQSPRIGLHLDLQK
ncbi:hypothetical protein TNCV_4680941 [Trichonephila clavipes]|nr:hypothetical protein TNCV_4680941 [Trichonephila clavipes]